MRIKPAFDSCMNRKKYRRQPASAPATEYVKVDVSQDLRKLDTTRRQLESVNEFIDRLMARSSCPASTMFEPAQTQLRMFVESAERLIVVLQNSDACRAAELRQELNLTWDELALATHRLVTQMHEIRDIDRASRSDQ